MAVFRVKQKRAPARYQNGRENPGSETGPCRAGNDGGKSGQKRRDRRLEQSVQPQFQKQSESAGRDRNGVADPQRFSAGERRQFSRKPAQDLRVIIPDSAGYRPWSANQLWRAGTSRAAGTEAATAKERFPGLVNLRWSGERRRTDRYTHPHALRPTFSVHPAVSLSFSKLPILFFLSSIVSV